MMLAVLALTLFGFGSPSNPRLYVHQHSPYVDDARWAREISLIKEIGFGGVRTEFDGNQMLDSEKKDVGNWGRRWMSTALGKIKGAGLKLHITLGDMDQAVAPEARYKVYRFIMETAAARFAPSDLTFDIANEPRAFQHLEPDAVRSLSTNAWIVLRAWEESGLKGKGYVLFSPTFHGWFGDWVNNAHLPTIDLATARQRYRERLAQVYGSSMKDWLGKVGAALNLYAPGRDPDVGTFAKQMASQIIADLRSRGVTGPITMTEFGIYKGSGISDTALGDKLGQMAAALLPIQELRFVTLYCLSEHPEYDLISPQGVRNEARIEALKAALRRLNVIPVAK